MFREFLVLALIGGSSVLAAQPPKMEPGDAHRRLDFLVGEWTLDARLRMNDEDHRSVHRADFHWLPGGVWLEQDLDMPGTPIGDMFGSARIAWDADAAEYVRYWMDNQSTVVLPLRGRFTDDGTLSFTGSFEWTDGTRYHQRLEMRATESGWTQVGYLGTDPENLRFNHDATAVRSDDTATARGKQPTAPPDWFGPHMRYMTDDGGRWVADNTAYRSDAEPFDAYMTEWAWGPGKQSIRGRLFGLVDGRESDDFWEFRMAWHPGENQVILQQFGIGGAVGAGPVEDTGPGRTRMLQTFHAPGQSESRVEHVTIETTRETHTTESFDVATDGTRTPRRVYTWHREKPPNGNP